MATDEDLIHIGAAMKVYTRPFMSGIYGVFEETFGQLIGTGSFLRVGCQSTLLTARHVLEERHTMKADGTCEYIGIAHYVRPGEAPAFIRGSMPSESHPVDLGLTLAVFPGGDSLQLTEQHFAPNSVGYAKDILFCHGFPDELSKPFFGVHSDTRPHIGGFQASVFDWYDRKIHVCIKWSPEELFDETGAPARFVKAYGMSGSLLWTTGRAQCKTLAEWRPEMARVVGVIHNWDQDARCLVGTRIEHVRNFLSVAAPQLTSV